MQLIYVATRLTGDGVTLLFSICSPENFSAGGKRVKMKFGGD
jgi:hypothetical protein